MSNPSTCNTSCGIAPCMCALGLAGRPVARASPHHARGAHRLTSGGVCTEPRQMCLRGSLSKPCCQRSSTAMALRGVPVRGQRGGCAQCLCGSDAFDSKVGARTAGQWPRMIPKGVWCGAAGGTESFPGRVKWVTAGARGRRQRQKAAAAGSGSAARGQSAAHSSTSGRARGLQSSSHLRCSSRACATDLTLRTGQTVRPNSRRSVALKWVGPIPCAVAACFTLRPRRRHWMYVRGRKAGVGRVGGGEQAGWCVAACRGQQQGRFHGMLHMHGTTWCSATHGSRRAPPNPCMHTSHARACC
jgi:hypothetical protein